MKNLELRKEDYIPSAAGGRVTFHLIKWDDKVKPFSLKTGGNINYHLLASDGTHPHTHEFAEIVLILSGRIGHLVNGERMELTSGDLLFIRPSDQHSFEQIQDEQCELVNFAFHLEFLRDLSHYLGNDYFLKYFTAPVTPPLFKLSASETDRLGMELMTINSLQVNSFELGRIKIKTVIADLFTRHFFKPGQGVSNPDIPGWMDELCNDMRDEKNLRKGLKAMQAMAPCTPEHLCKCFRKYLDKSPTEFINELRINHAARMLADTTEEIFAIATDLGFQSLSRFYHVFKKHYGVSPKRYRLIARKNDIPV